MIECVLSLSQSVEGWVWICLDHINTSTPYLASLTDKEKTNIFSINLCWPILQCYTGKVVARHPKKHLEKNQTQRCETPKTLSKKTNMGYRRWTTDVSYGSPNHALTRTFTVPINHHTGNEEQSLSWENNRREKINKVSSGAIRKRNNEVWRNSLKRWRRQLARLKPAAVKGGARCSSCVGVCFLMHEMCKNPHHASIFRSEHPSELD